MNIFYQSTHIVVLLEKMKLFWTNQDKIILNQDETRRWLISWLINQIELSAVLNTNK